MDLWSDGTSPLTSVRYWPYGAAGREIAESWPVSDTPHVLAEALGSARTPRLLATGQTEKLSAVDVERRGPAVYVTHRQPVCIKPNLWVIIDQVRSGSGIRHASLWRTAHDVALRPGHDGRSDLLVPVAGRLAVSLHFRAFLGSKFGAHPGSAAPWAGWQVVGAHPQPAPAVSVDQPGGEEWLMVVLKRNSGAGELKPGAASQMVGQPTEDNWSMLLPAGGIVRTNSRHGERIVRRTGEGLAARAEMLDLTPAPDYASQSGSTGTAFGRMLSEYSRFQELKSRRVKVTGLLLARLGGQELVLLFFRRKRPGAEFPLRLAAIGSWCGLAAWLHFSFLWHWAAVAPNIAASFPVTRLRTRWPVRSSSVVVPASSNPWNAS